MELQKSGSSSSSKNKSRSKRPRRDSDEDSSDLIVDIEMSPSSSKSRTPQSKSLTASTSSTNKKRRKRDSASSDEERWLTAIESGKLEDVDDELKKIKPKDPSLMTARQRAMYDRSTDNVTTPSQGLISLPTGYKEKVMTPEAIQKAQIKSQKRKQVADEKREKDKKKTLERLLKKQESKALKTAKSKNARASVPVILYKQTNESTIVSYPVNIDYPLKAAKAVNVKPQVCSMNCGNLKKYSCSKTGAALCSLECYKKNISSRIL